MRGYVGDGSDSERGKRKGTGIIGLSILIILASELSRLDYYRALHSSVW